MQVLRAEAPSTAKHVAIVMAARRIFVERGYGAASMDDVARAAGVAKQTVYKHFGSKAALFRAIVEGIAVDLLSPVAVPGAGTRETDPAAALGALGRRFVTLVVDPASVGLFRLLVAEASRFPELAEPIYHAGPDRLVRELSAFLERATEAGWLAVENPRMAAEQFFGALRGNIQLRAAFAANPIAPEPYLAYADSAVAAFLRAHAVK